MNLLTKLTIRKKEKDKENYFDFYLNAELRNLKHYIYELSTLRRKDQKYLREEISNKIIKELNKISKLYAGFIEDLKKFKNTKNNISKDELKDFEERLELMLEKKKSLRKDFEKIYINFKRTALGMSDVPMKKILKMMYLAFDFNSQLYLSEKTSKESNFQRYYDSISMQIKYIF